MKKMFYLAYGSNLNTKQMEWRCPSAKVAGTAVLENWRLEFRGSKTGAYLTIVPAFGERVQVGVWQVGPEDEQALDRYEGFPNFYYKRNFTVELNGKKIPAFAYIMRENRPSGIPSISYVRTCITGFAEFGFDTEPLMEAVERSYENEEE